MDVVSHSALPAAGRVWKPRPGASVLAFVCKATFTLAPGKLELAPEQQWSERPFPADFDMGYFNVAPLDQQLPALRAGDRLTLTNLHRDHPQLVMTLPQIGPRATVAGPGRRSSRAASRATSPRSTRRSPAACATMAASTARSC